jgi:hypothetical protein
MKKFLFFLGGVLSVIQWGCVTSAGGESIVIDGKKIRYESTSKIDQHEVENIISSYVEKYSLDGSDHLFNFQILDDEWKNKCLINGGIVRSTEECASYALIYHSVTIDGYKERSSRMVFKECKNNKCLYIIGSDNLSVE